MTIAYLLKLALFPVWTQYILIAVVLIWGYLFAKPNYEQHRAMVMGDKMALQTCVAENRKQGDPSPSKANQQKKANERGLLPLHNFDVTESRIAHSPRDAKLHKEQ